MPKCSTCSQNEAVISWWEKTRNWLAWHLFPTDMHEAMTEAHTNGSAEGYVMGRKHQREVYNLQDIIKDMQRSGQLNRQDDKEENI